MTPAEHETQRRRVAEALAADFPLRSASIPTRPMTPRAAAAAFTAVATLALAAPASFNVNRNA